MNKNPYVMSALAMVATGTLIVGGAHYANSILKKEKPSLEQSLDSGQLQFGKGRILEPLDLDPNLEGNDAVYVTRPHQPVSGVVFVDQSTSLNNSQLYANLFDIRPGLKQEDVTIARSLSETVRSGLQSYDSLKGLEFSADLIDYTNNLDAKGGK